MPNFFDTIATLKTYAGGAANQSLELTSMEPAFAAAINTHLRPWMGEAFYTEFKTDFDASTMDAAQTAFLPYFRRPLAMLALYEYSKIGSVQFSEMGLIRVEGENMKTAWKYQENEYRKFMLHNGYDALEEMLKHLETNKADHTTWATGPGRDRHMSTFLNTSEMFRTYYAVYISRYTYETLRPLINDLEMFVFVDLLGQDQYDALRTNFLAGTLSAEETVLLKYMRIALANLAVKEGIRRAWIRLEGNNVVSEESLEPQSLIRQGAPTSAQMSLAMMMQQEWGERYLSKVKTYLDNNLDVFTLYSDYQDELAAAAEEEALEDCPTAEWPERAGCVKTWGACSCAACAAGNTGCCSAHKGVVGF